MKLSRDIGIDLGTANVLVYEEGRGIVLREPSVVAVDKNTGKVLQVGAAARNMLGRTPGNIVAVRPLRDGVISDYEMTEKMLEQFLKKIIHFALIKPRVIVSVPSGVTEVEERAVIQATMEAGARRVYLIEEPFAAALGATAVVTTATDVNGKFSVDTWAAEHGCAISDMGGAKQISAEILEHSVPVCSDFPIQGPLPDGLVLGESGELGIYVGYRCSAPFMHTLRLVPRVLRVGVGCRKGISREAVEAAIQTAFASHDLDLNAVKGVYSIDLKRQEAGLLAACEEHGWSATFYTAEELRAVTGEFTESPFVQGVTGIGNVCERAAMLGAERLLVRKCAGNGVTIAVSAETWEVDFG